MAGGVRLELNRLRVNRILGQNFLHESWSAPGVTANGIVRKWPIYPHCYELASMVRAGAVSPAELVEAHLSRIRPEVNAFVMLREEAIEEARNLAPGGVLRGIPVTVKDSFDVAGLPTRSGTRLRPATPAAEDATAVARLRAAGAIIIGKTNTPELLASYETDNCITGRTNNPWDLERTPGGSSGGEAAAIASGCSAGGLGTRRRRLYPRARRIFAASPASSRRPGAFPPPATSRRWATPAVWSALPGRWRAPRRISGCSSPCWRATTPRTRSPCRCRSANPRPPRRASASGSSSMAFRSTPRSAHAVRRAGLLLGAEEFAPAGLERAPNLWAFLFSQLARLHDPQDDRRARGRSALDAPRIARARRRPPPPSRCCSPSPRATACAPRCSARCGHAGAADAGLRDPGVPPSGAPLVHRRERDRAVSGDDAGRHRECARIARRHGADGSVSAAGLPIGVQLLGRPFEDELLLETAIRLEAARGPFTPCRPSPPSSRT